MVYEPSAIESNECTFFIFMDFFYRSDEHDYCEMVCTLLIDAELLKTPLKYKYVIYSHKVTKEDEYYEKLHPFIDYWYEDPDRVLHLSSEEHCFAGEGMLHT